MLFQILACVFHEGRVAGASALARGARVRVCSAGAGRPYGALVDSGVRWGLVVGVQLTCGGGAIDLVVGVQLTKGRA